MTGSKQLQPKLAPQAEYSTDVSFENRSRVRRLKGFFASLIDGRSCKHAGVEQRTEIERSSQLEKASGLSNRSGVTSTSSDFGERRVERHASASDERRGEVRGCLAEEVAVASSLES